MIEYFQMSSIQLSSRSSFADEVAVTDRAIAAIQLLIGEFDNLGNPFELLIGMISREITLQRPLMGSSSGNSGKKWNRRRSAASTCESTGRRCSSCR